MLESELERRFVEYVKAHGGIAYKWTSPGRRGVPDRIVVLPGHILFVELKTETGQLTPWQVREHQRLKALGHTVLVIRRESEFVCVL